MNEYTFSDIKVGMKQSFKRKLSDEDFKAFQKLSGDSNPLHTNATFAKDNKFKDSVAYGMLVSSFISTLCGMHLPGKYCLILSVESQMKNPAYAGDILEICGEVTSKVEPTKTLVIKTTITNQSGQTIQSGKVMVKVLK